MDMGSVRDEGNQYIGWKYYTPLKADYINTFMSQVITPGLVTRPQISLADPDTSQGNDTVTFQIHPFTAYIEPDDGARYVDENGKSWNSRLIKITMSEVSDMHSITSDTVAIGMTYTLINPETGANRSWYAMFHSLTAADIPNFNGLIIATVQHIEYPLGTQGAPADYYHFNITTSGADISNVLLEKEGWNPECWLSLISPRRAVTVDTSDPQHPRYSVTYNKFELRRYNDALDITISGRNGINTFTNKTIDTLIVGNASVPNNFIDPYGFRGFMNNNITLVCLNTRKEGNVVPGVQLQGANSISDLNNITGGLNGGAIAYIDATDNNQYKATPISSSEFFDKNGHPDKYEAICVFTNTVKLKPVHSEIQSISKFETYTDSNNVTKGRLYIR